MDFKRILVLVFILVQIVDGTELCGRMCSWSGWSPWDECSSTCGGGERVRKRGICSWMWQSFRRKLEYCNKKREHAYERESCNKICRNGDWSDYLNACECEPGFKGICCDEATAYLTEWSPWTTCTHTCGGGRQNRERVCRNERPEDRCDPYEDTREARGCNWNPCPEPVIDSGPSVEIISTVGGGSSLQFITRPKNQTISTVNIAIFECKANDIDATVSWSHNGRRIGDGVDAFGIQKLPRGVLLITNVDSVHYGKYTCEIEKEGKKLKADAYLLATRAMVNCDRHLDFAEIPRNAIVKENLSIYLTCRGDSRSPVRTTWFHKGLRLIPDSRVRILVNGYLHINNVQLSDAGSYRCVITVPNLNCSRDATATLTVYRDVQDVCGKTIKLPSSERPTGYIAEGMDAPLGATPWHAMLAVVYETETINACGAALLDHQWVITAAHCFISLEQRYGRVFYPDEFRIYLGRYSADLRRQEPNEKILIPIDYYVHENFSYQLLDYDLALIKLTHSISFSDYIRPVCLSTNETLRDNLRQAGQLGTVTGWGELRASSPDRPKYLRSVDVPIVKRKTCQDSTNFTMTTRMFCAGYGRAGTGDACRGDSGGPLVVKQDGQHNIVGLVSWGDEAGCSAEGKYGFYTDLDDLYDWIEDIRVNE